MKLRTEEAEEAMQQLEEVLMMMIINIIKALAQIPISTFSHIWVFVRQYGIMFVIIVIIIIIIIIVMITIVVT